MPTVYRRRVVAAAAALVLLAAAAAGTVVLSGHHGAGDQPRTQHDAERLLTSYRVETVALVPGSPRYAETLTTLAPCGNGVSVTEYYDLTFPSGTPPDAFTPMRKAWKGYTTLSDTSTGGPQRQLVVENPADGVRLGLTLRAGRALRLTLASPCVPPAAKAVPPVQLSDLAEPEQAYQAYVDGQLDVLSGQVAALRAALAAGDTGRARAAWLPAQLTWEHLGAAYGSFGDLADAVDGLPRDGANWTGLHRIEHGLWGGEPAAALVPVADTLTGDVAKLRDQLPQILDDPASLPVRCHEILEDALRDHVSGLTDFGAGAAYQETYADLQVTRIILDQLESLVTPRSPGLVGTAHRQLDVLQSALLAPAPGRQAVDAALGALLETLAPVPDLLEPPQS